MVNFFSLIFQAFSVKYFGKQKTEMFRLLESFMCYPKQKSGLFRKKIIIDLNPPKPLSFVGELHRFGI